mmetsp:Transcript_10724/g.23312  ORF Transcript_10724/g.23312 Transcript_10724/m.23312 type:complete len:310 (-) Transcript_10724:332-1261(-)
MIDERRARARCGAVRSPTMERGSTPFSPSSSSSSGSDGLAFPLRRRICAGVRVDRRDSSSGPISSSDSSSSSSSSASSGVGACRRASFFSFRRCFSARSGPPPSPAFDGLGSDLSPLDLPAFLASSPARSFWSSPHSPPFAAASSAGGAASGRCAVLARFFARFLAALDCPPPPRGLSSADGSIGGAGGASSEKAPRSGSSRRPTRPTGPTVRARRGVLGPADADAAAACRQASRPEKCLRDAATRPRDVRRGRRATCCISARRPRPGRSVWPPASPPTGVASVDVRRADGPLCDTPRGSPGGAGPGVV